MRYIGIDFDKKEDCVINHVIYPIHHAIGFHTLVSGKLVRMEQSVGAVEGVASFPLLCTVN